LRKPRFEPEATPNQVPTLERDDGLRGATGGIQRMSRRPAADHYITLLSRPDPDSTSMCLRDSETSDNHS